MKSGLTRFFQIESKFTCLVEKSLSIIYKPSARPHHGGSSVTNEYCYATNQSE